MFVITIDTDVCDGCGQCAESCPAQIISMIDGRAQVVGNADECLGCQACVIVCPTKGITLDEY